MRPSKIFLVGLPASGKTTFAKKLAEELKFNFIDLDEEIALSTGKSIPEIFDQSGEEHFRNLERDHLKKMVNEFDQYVLATGGGTPCFFSNMALMNESGITIYLNIPLDQIEERLKKDISRPLMKDFKIEELHQKRLKWYQRAKKTVSSYSELAQLFD